MTTAFDIRKGQGTRWLIAAAVTCTFLLGFWPATLVAAQWVEDDVSCCCSSQSDAQPASVDKHNCEASNCDCHLAPDDTSPTPLDATTSGPSSVTVIQPTAVALLYPHIGNVELHTSAPRGDPDVGSPPIYLENQVFLL